MSVGDPITRASAESIQRTFLIALLTALTAGLGLVACTGELPITSRPLPTLPPTPTTSPVDERYFWLERRPTVEHAAWGWMSHYKAELAKELALAILNTVPFLGTSYSAQITRNVEVKVVMPEYTEADFPLSTIPAEVRSTFTVDHPTEGGTYQATMPITLDVDGSLPLEQMITGYSIASEELSLDKQYSR